MNKKKQEKQDFFVSIDIHQELVRLHSKNY